MNEIFGFIPWASQNYLSTCKIFHILNFLISLKKVVFELFCRKFVHVLLVSFYVVKTKNAGSRNIF